MVFYEDMIPGEKTVGPCVTVDATELLEFARIWDPMPFHVDETAGKAAFGSVTAPGIYTLALKQRLVHQLPDPPQVIASLGYDEVRFHQPVRPNDTLQLRVEWLSRRESRSKPDRGIVVIRFELVNQHGVTVMSHLDTVLVRRREPAVRTPA